MPAAAGTFQGCLQGGVRDHLMAMSGRVKAFWAVAGREYDMPHVHTYGSYTSVAARYGLAVVRMRAVLVVRGWASSAFQSACDVGAVHVYSRAATRQPNTPRLWLRTRLSRWCEAFSASQYACDVSTLHAAGVHS
jgi:hypothetical protein